jgi:hypothetical protein
MLIPTVPYVGKRLHLDPDPDPKLNYGSGSEHANNFGSGRIRIHNSALKFHLEIEKARNLDPDTRVKYVAHV